VMHAEAGGAIIDPTPGLEGTCPACREPVRSKCGELVAWHFAHLASDDCDRWSEPESEWHRGWKLLVPREQREVVIGPHRADIVTADGTVVELQHSSLSLPEVREREAFYGRMTWLVDCTDLGERFSLRRKADHVTFRWRWCRKWLLHTTKPVLLDLPQGVLRVRKMHGPERAAGWGHLWSRDAVVDRLHRVRAAA
jgi:hypothetical protein